MFGPLNVIVLSYLFLLPLFLVWFIGAVMILKRPARHPQVARLLLLALGVLLVAHHIDIALNLTLPDFLRGRGLPVEQTVSILRFKQGILTTIDALAWGLTIWAAFGWRRQVNNPATGSE